MADHRSAAVTSQAIVNPITFLPRSKRVRFLDLPNRANTNVLNTTNANDDFEQRQRALCFRARTSGSGLSLTAVLREKHNFPALADGCEECMGVKIASLLSRRTGTH
jgi:hypothetical protein